MEATNAPTPAPVAGADEKLRRTALGVPDIVFFIVAASAPLTVVAGGVASTYLVTGNAGVPLLFLVLGAILALFVSGYAAMSHHITNAGAFYAYVSQGISKIAGVGTAFVALVAYNSMQIGILGLFGAVFSGFMLDKTGIDFAWYSWVFIAIALIGVLGWLRVDLNAKVLALFLTAEIIVVAVFDLVVLGDPSPQGIVSDGFDPSIAFGAGLGAALSFTFAAFVGFESAAIYGEECKDPRRTVARATYIALGDHLTVLRLQRVDAGERRRHRRRHQPGAADRGRLRDAGRDGAGPDDDPVHNPRRTALHHDRRHRDPALLHEPVRGLALVPQRRQPVLLRARSRRGASERLRHGRAATGRPTSARSRRP